MIAATPFGVVRAHADRTPDRVALTAGERTWSYAELVTAAERAAGGLLAHGLRPGDRVAVIAGNAPEVAITWLGGSRSGVVPALVNSRLTAPELAPLLARLDPALVLTDPDHALVCREALAGAGAATVPLLEIGQDAAALFDAAPATGPEPGAADLFEITFTSGTTSLPKSVALTQGSEVEHWGAVAATLGLSAQDHALITTPLFHASGIRNGCFLGWSAGGGVSVEPGFSTSAFWRRARETGATWTCFVETMVALLLRRPVEEAERDHALRFAIGGGTPDPLRVFEDRTGVRVVQAYGMSECGMVATVAPDRPEAEVRALRAARPDSSLAGIPVDGCEVRVVDATGAEAAVDVPGEVLVRSSGMFREYLGDPEATAKALRDGWLHTGDLAVRGAGGELYFLDRIRDVIRRGGENIAAREVEAVLDAHPDVLRSAVFPEPDPLWVQEVRAAVVPRPGAAPTAAELWSWCAERLAKYKVPRYLGFVTSLPENASGRLDKTRLRGTSLDGVHDHDQHLSGAR